MTPTKQTLLTSASFMFLVAGCASAELVEKPNLNPDALERAEDINAQMTDEERVTLTLGHLAMPFFDSPPPEEARPGAGYVPGIPRLGVPALYETDASHGVTWLGGSRGSGGTALPSGIAQGATWNTDLIETGGQMIGGEAHAKGFNVLLAGGINLMRDPRNGRTFEYMGEDPLHSALLGAAAVRGIQSQNVVSTLKHYAINPQETGRHFMNVVIDEGELRESDLLAFEIAIEESGAGSLMCAYNRLNGPLSCGSEFLLTKVLREDWDYKGFVMSDWGAVEALDFALAGLDQQSGAALDEGLFMGEPLLEAAKTDPAYKKRLGEMATNILYAIYDNGLDQSPPVIKDVDRDTSEAVALAAAEEAIVLLKNANSALPLSKGMSSVAVIGGLADAGTPVGGGSSRVHSDEGPSATIPFLPIEGGPFGAFLGEEYNHASPLKAIREALPDAKVSYRDGRYPEDAAVIAASADVAIVFATQYQTEGYDVPTLSLPNNQDELIAAVAAANPNTIVVLETGGPVLMPWLDDVAGVIEAWYPGAKGGEAIANVLFGDVNPSGHLPVTFPASTEQLPRPELDGLYTVPLSMFGRGEPGAELNVDYNIEGSDIGYRWFARKNLTPLFPFGYGLSYSEFALGDLDISGPAHALTASFSLSNTGDVAGADVAQLYLTAVNGATRQRLVGFAKKDLEPGEAVEVALDIDPRLMAEWENDAWVVEAGVYEFALGNDAGDLLSPVSVDVRGFEIAPDGKTIR